jgi:hypothetical protein
MEARSYTKIEVIHQIIRGCTHCGHPREVGKPCGGCGNPHPPTVHDLGVQAYDHRDPSHRALWRRVGEKAAEARAKLATRYLDK